MQDRSGNNTPSDRFSEYMRERLEDHRVPVDPGDWQMIVSRMEKKKKPRYLWIGGLLAAALLGGLIWMLVPPMDNAQEDVIVYVPETETEKEMQPGTDMREEQPEVEVPKKTLREKSAVATKEYIAKAITPEKEPECVAEEEIAEENSAEQKEEENIVRQKEEKEDDVTPKPQEKKPELKPIVRHKRYGSEIREIPRRKKQKEWMIAAAVSSGGNISSNVGAPESFLLSDFVNPGASEIYTESPLTTNWEPEGYADISHNIPLSFGITVRKQLYGQVAIETGLVYTYLSSKMRKNEFGPWDNRLEHHYLGIPVNLIVDLWSDSRWKLYISGGGMMEKGLRSVFTQKNYMSQKGKTKVDKKSIDGLQWSVNASVGVSYRFYEDWSFYAEPKLYYYFDSDQPLSTRTEDPFGVGIGAGIRFQF